jgi:hypothetical protein
MRSKIKIGLRNEMYQSRKFKMYYRIQNKNEAVSVAAAPPCNHS